MKHSDLTTSGKSILIIDDDDTYLGLMQDFMSSFSFHSEFVGTCEEALEKIKTTKFDAIFVDYRLTMIEGTDVAKALRAHYYIGPIYCLTCMPPGTINNGKAIFNAIIEKPLDVDKLKSLGFV